MALPVVVYKWPAPIAQSGLPTMCDSGLGLGLGLVHIGEASAARDGGDERCRPITRPSGRNDSAACNGVTQGGV